MLFDVKNYLDNVAQTPKEYYQGLIQATINDQWTNTTQLYTIKEQSALPFTDDYTNYEAWLDVVSDNMINTSKVYSDFVRVLFKDINHKQNYKGQYYKIALVELSYHNVMIKSYYGGYYGVSLL